MALNTTSTKKTGTSRLEAEVTKEVKAFFEKVQKSGRPFWFQKISDRYTSGLPDYIFCYYGRFGAVELKRENVKQRLHPYIDFLLATALQAFTLTKIRKAGGACLATDNLADVKALLNSISPLDPID